MDGEQAEENHRRKSEQHLRSGLRWFLGCIIGLIIFLLAFFGQNRNLENRELHNKIDSLQSELFIHQINVQRYEIALDMIKDEDSVLYEKFENYLSETE